MHTFAFRPSNASDILPLYYYFRHNLHLHSEKQRATSTYITKLPKIKGATSQVMSVTPYCAQNASHLRVSTSDALAPCPCPRN